MFFEIKNYKTKQFLLLNLLKSFLTLHQSNQNATYVNIKSMKVTCIKRKIYELKISYNIKPFLSRNEHIRCWKN